MTNSKTYLPYLYKYMRYRILNATTKLKTSRVVEVESLSFMYSLRTLCCRLVVYFHGDPYLRLGVQHAKLTEKHFRNKIIYFQCFPKH